MTPTRYDQKRYGAQDANMFSLMASMGPIHAYLSACKSAAPNESHYAQFIPGPETDIAPGAADVALTLTPSNAAYGRSLFIDAVVDVALFDGTLDAQKAFRVSDLGRGIWDFFIGRGTAVSVGGGQFGCDCGGYPLANVLITPSQTLTATLNPTSALAVTTTAYALAKLSTANLGD